MSNIYNYCLQSLNLLIKCFLTFSSSKYQFSGKETYGKIFINDEQLTNNLDEHFVFVSFYILSNNFVSALFASLIRKKPAWL